MYMNWLCPMWMWIDPGLSSQLALPLAGLTPQHPWRARCCWPARLQHLKRLADASSPPAVPIPLPPQQLSSSSQLGCGIPTMLISNPVGCPARDAQRVCVRVCVCAVAVLLFHPEVLALLLLPYCWFCSATHWQWLPRNPPLKLFSATGDAPKIKY